MGSYGDYKHSMFHTYCLLENKYKSRADQFKTDEGSKNLSKC